MRPGQLRPGNPGSREAQPRKVPGRRASHHAMSIASMRPGQLRPGNRSPRAHPVADRLAHAVGFNEAGAASPRKSRSGRVSHRRLVGDASMRPGQLRPGNPVMTDDGGLVRRFNEAGAASPRKSPTGRSDVPPRLGRASMRPGQLRPGNRWRRGTLKALGLILKRASMRPGQLRPGNAGSAASMRPAPEIGGAVGGRASMRPGQLRPGNGSVVTPCAVESCQTYCERSTSCSLGIQIVGQRHRIHSSYLVAAQ